jgi:hypothetical protein
MAEDNPRVQFQAAHAQWKAAEQRMAAAVEASSAGLAALQAAQAEVAGLEHDAAAYAERCVAAGLQANGLDIEEHLRRQTRANFDLEQARRRLGLLNAEREGIAAELSRRQVAVTLLLERVLSAEAEEMAAQVQEVERLGRDMRHSLAGLSRFWLTAGQSRSIRLGKQAMEVLAGQNGARDGEPQFRGPAGGTQDPVALAQAHWQRIGAALLKDPSIDVESIE